MTKILLFLLIHAMTFAVAGASTQAEITYLAADQIYLNAGSESGVVVGDSVRVLDSDGGLLGWLQVAFVASSSSAAKVLGLSVTPVIGMSAEILTQPDYDDVIQTVESTTIAEPSVKTLETQGVRELQERKRKRHPELRARVSGGLDLSSWEEEHTLREPWVRISAGITNLTRYGHSLRLRMRAIRSLQEGADSETDVRIGEMAFENASDARVHYSLGMTRVQHHAGIGVIRGATLESELLDGLTVGAFGGVSPMPGEDDLGNGRSQYGLRIEGQGRRGDLFATGGLAFAGRYIDGEYEQEFVNQTMSLRKGRRFSLQQTAQVELNRDWRDTGDTPALELSYFSCRVNYAQTPQLRFSLAVDAGETVRPFGSREVADSLFSKNARRGLRLGANFPIVSRFLVDAWGGVRHFASLDSDSYHAGVRLHQRTPLWQNLFLQGRLAWFDNNSADGWQPSLLSFWRLHHSELSAELGINRLHYVESDTSVLEKWVRGSVEWYPVSAWMLALSADMQWADTGNRQGLCFELAWGL